jgi:hypothetical protein
MSEEESTNFTGFVGQRLIASGALAHVGLKAKALLDAGENEPIFIFEDATGLPTDLDFRGTPDEFLEKLTPKRGPGRPKLGVVCREISLLPRHWDWLNTQPGGASVTLRKLVEAAKRDSQVADKARRSQEAAYRFMSAMAGDFPGFEEAARALFANSSKRFDSLTRTWPHDIRDQVRKLAAISFRDAEAAASA